MSENKEICTTCHGTGCRHCDGEGESCSCKCHKPKVEGLAERLEKFNEQHYDGQWMSDWYPRLASVARQWFREQIESCRSTNGIATGIIYLGDLLKKLEQ